MAIAAIVADDYSSATDCGVQFSSRGLDTVALMEIPGPASVQAYDVASIDTDSRAAGAALAYARVKQAAELIDQVGYRYVYKSIDSTVRGNLGPEVDAMLDVLRPEFALVAPAFPYWGRTTINGNHFLHGVPISESQFAHDPVWPIRESNLVRLLASQTKRAVASIELAGIRGSVGDFVRRLNDLKAHGVEIVVLDAETEQDLERIAHLAATTGRRSLIVGSTGLSQYLADAWGIATDRAPSRLQDRPGPVMLVAGSASPTTRKQIERFVAEGATFSLVLDAAAMVTGDFEATIPGKLRAVQAAIGDGKDICIHLDSTPESVLATQALGEARGLNKLEVSSLIVSTLAAFVARVVASSALNGIVLTGGDTAKAVCAALGSAGMRLMSEVEPGIPVGRLIGPHELTVVTKAGAFGSEDALSKARRVLRGES